MFSLFFFFFLLSFRVLSILNERRGTDSIDSMFPTVSLKIDRAPSHFYISLYSVLSIWWLQGIEIIPEICNLSLTLPSLPTPVLFPLSLSLPPSFFLNQIVHSLTDHSWLSFSNSFTHSSLTIRLSLPLSLSFLHFHTHLLSLPSPSPLNQLSLTSGCTRRDIGVPSPFPLSSPAGLPPRAAGEYGSQRRSIDRLEVKWRSSRSEETLNRELRDYLDWFTWEETRKKRRGIGKMLSDENFQKLLYDLFCLWSGVQRHYDPPITDNAEQKAMKVRKEYGRGRREITVYRL